MAYEGGRSITGPFLGSLGASATIIGFVAGLGELLGYGLRSVSVFWGKQVQEMPLSRRHLRHCPKSQQAAY